MRIKNWREFISEKVNTNELRYYIFDVDDNLLFMDTKIHLQHFEDGKWFNKDVSTNEYAQIRKKYPYNSLDNSEWRGSNDTSFVEFRDFGPRGNDAFMEDSKKAIKKKKFGPSWEIFLNVLIEGRLFAIVTSRGHEPPTFRKFVRYIIENVLTKEEKSEMIENLSLFNAKFGVVTDDPITQYLNMCYFIGLTSKAFYDEFQYTAVGSLANQGKKDAINKFVNYVREFAKRTKSPIKIGFSDDDIHFTNVAKELFMSMEKSLDFIENFYVFDTSNPKVKGGVKVKI